MLDFTKFSSDSNGLVKRTNLLLFASNHCFPIFVSPIVPPQDNIRGALSALFLLFINVGFLLAYAIGPNATYWGLTASGGILSLFYVPFTWYIPESPFYLVLKGEFKVFDEKLNVKLFFPSRSRYMKKEKEERSYRLYLCLSVLIRLALNQLWTPTLTISLTF